MYVALGSCRCRHRAYPARSALVREACAAVEERLAELERAGPDAIARVPRDYGELLQLHSGVASLSTSRIDLDAGRTLVLYVCFVRSLWRPTYISRSIIGQLMLEGLVASNGRLYEAPDPLLWDAFRGKIWEETLAAFESAEASGELAAGGTPVAEEPEETLDALVRDLRQGHPRLPIARELGRISVPPGGLDGFAAEIRCADATASGLLRLGMVTVVLGSWQHTFGQLSRAVALFRDAASGTARLVETRRGGIVCRSELQLWRDGGWVAADVEDQSVRGLVLGHETRQIRQNDPALAHPGDARLIAQADAALRDDESGSDRLRLVIWAAIVFFAGFVYLLLSR